MLLAFLKRFSKGSIKMLAGAAVIEGLICFEVCVLGWQVSGGCWLESPVAVHVNCLSVLVHGWLSPQ